MQSTSAPLRVVEGLDPSVHGSQACVYAGLRLNHVKRRLFTCLSKVHKISMNFEVRFEGHVAGARFIVGIVMSQGFRQGLMSFSWGSLRQDVSFALEIR